MPASLADERLRPRFGLSLRQAARGWFVVTLIGQLMFTLFIIGFYYASIVTDNFAGWDAKPNITGFEPGDAAGNRQFAGHVLLAAVMTLAGLAQLVPALRRRWPRLHRWSGRLFLATAALLALGGLWLTWGRGSYLTVTGALAISIDAALILFCGAQAFITARARDFAAHRRWALRTFIVASGVWFMRVGYMAWALATRGAGMSRGMDGPFDLFWAFATYLLPLAVLELYLRAERGSARAQGAMAAGLWLGNVVILAGSIGAWALMWMPYL